MKDGRNDDRVNDPPAVPEIRAALSRVIASDPFRTAPQLVAFLSFIVEKTIAGESGELKGYTIATRALGRPPEFDPQIDPIVRVEAMRLRRALQTYYGGAGAGDPLIISVPRGSYVPQFSLRGSIPEVPPALAGSPTDWEPDRPALLTSGRIVTHRVKLAAAVVGGLLLGVLGTLLTGQTPLVATVTKADATFPVLIVSAVEVEQGASFDGPALRSALIETLAPFDEVTVMEETSAPAGVRTYRLNLRAMVRGNAHAIAARLTHVSSGEVIWSRLLPMEDASSASGDPRLRVAKQVALFLASPFGVLASDQRERLQDDPRAACISTVYAYWFDPSEAAHAAARNCLETEFAKGPPNHLAMAYLAFVYLDEERSRFNPRPGSLDRALALAHRAVEYGPESARARQVLMNVRFARGEIESAIETGRGAIRLNPIDSEFKANFGSRLVEVGRYREGLDLLAQANDLSPNAPGKRFLSIFIGNFMLDEMDRAAAAAERTLPGHPLSLIASTIMAAKAGRPEEAARTLKQLESNHPDVYKNPAGYLLQRGMNREIVARLIGELASSGLESMVSGAIPAGN